MGTYAAVADIQAEFKSIDFSATGAAISTADATEFITQEEAGLESEVSSVYSVPITGTKAIAVMKLMTTLMVKARILDILPVKTGSRPPEQGESESEKLRTRVTDMVEKIRKKEMMLIGAVLLESSGGIKSYAVDNDLDHTFLKGEDQW